jgi:hypothetical protein
VITDKNHHPVLNGNLAVPDVEILENTLSTNTNLDQIFAKVSVVFEGNNFTCSPAIFSTDNQRKKVFECSHKISKDERLAEGSLSQDIKVIYTVEEARLAAIKSKFPIVEYSHELELVYKYVQSEVVPSGVSLVLKQSNNNLLLLVLDGKNLLLANQYHTSNLDDVFYFTMLAVEQLELDIESTSLFWSDNPDFTPYQNLQSLFENYIGTIKLLENSNTFDALQNMHVKCG